MQHRHLETPNFTPAAVDDIIRRGGWREWVALRRAAHREPAVLERIRSICAAAAHDPAQEGALRLNFWNQYARRLTASMG